MKKLYTFLLTAAIATGVNAQTYLSKDFNDNSVTSGGWTVQEPTPATTTSLTWTTATVGAPSAYGMMKNWNGAANEAVESWLISSAMNLSTSTTPMLSFNSAYNYNGAALQLQISTNYDGVSAPSTATWTNITSSAAWSAGGWAWTGSGNIDLSAYNVSGVYIAFVYTGSTADGSTWEIDDILVNEGGAAAPAAHSVYEIQSTLGTADSSYYADSIVLTGGIVTAVRPDSRYYIQAGSGPWSGIYVYDNANTVAIGDSVTMQAMVVEFNGLTELTSVSNHVVVSSGNAVPQTIITTAQSMTEDYEGVLVTMQNATCTQATNGFGEWIIDDGSGASTIDDFMYAYAAATGGPYEVTGIVDYAFGFFKVQPRMMSDIVTSVVVPTRTVYEIQSTLGTGDSSYYHDSIVFTGGIVSAVRPDGRYYIQSGSGPWSGIFVYDNVNTVVEGDSVTFNTIVSEFNGLTELTSVSNHTIVSSGNAIPQTITTSANGSIEDYEGVLITVLTANCTSGANGFGEWVINDGSGASTVGDFMYAFPAVTGGTYTVTGIVDFAFGSFIVQPRYAADVLDYTGVEENNELNTALYPNPAATVVTIEAPVNSEIKVYSVDGKVCFSTSTSNNIERIDVSGLESGNYIVSIINNNLTSTQKLIIE